MNSLIPFSVFIACATYILYVVAGYPLLLGLLAHFRRRPFQRRFAPRSVSVIIAVRDGAPWISRKLESINALDYPADLIEIIVVSDGSTDGTEDLLAANRDPRLRFFHIPPSGKAVALTEGIGYARNEILVFTDVRQQLESSSLRRMIECFADSEVGGVSGDVVIRPSDKAEEINIALFRRYETWIRGRLSDLDSMFGATGCLYAVRRSLAVRIPAGVLLDDMYQPLSIFFRGYRTVIDVTARAFDEPVPLEAEFNRKVRTLAGNFQLLGYFPSLLLPRNRMWVHFLSYKFARLLLPYALILLSVSSLWLPRPLWDIAILLQVSFLLMALFDRVVPERSLFKQITSAARAFIIMLVADLCACAIFVVPGRRLWSRSTYSQQMAKAR